LGIVVALFAGMFAGLVYSAYKLKRKEKVQSKKRKSKYDIEDELTKYKISESSVKQEADNQSNNRQSCLSKIDKSISYTMFNCECDGEDPKEYIHGKMLEQDQKYGHKKPNK